MNDIDSRLKAILKKNLKLKKIPNNINKLSFGYFNNWDSLNHFKILIAIEEEFNLKFPTEVFNKLKSISEIKKYIKNNDK